MEQCGPLELDMFSDEGNHEPILVQITPTCHGREEGDDGEDLYSSSDGRWLALLEAGQQRQPLTCSTSLFHTTHNSNSSSLVAVGCFNNLILVREAGHEHEAEKYGWTMVDVAAESPFAPVPLTPCLDHTISTYSSLTVFSLHSFALLAARSSFSNKRNGKRLGKRQSLLRRHSATTRHLQRTLDSVSASSYSSSSSSLKCAQHVVKLLVDLITPLTTSSSSATTAITCQPLIPENYFEEENQLARLMLDGDYVVLDPFYLSCPPPPACIPDPDHLIHYSPFSHSLLDNMMQRIVSDHASEDRKTIKSHLHTKHLLDGILQIPHHNPDPTIPCANPLLLVNIDASSAALLMNSYIHVPLPFSIHESRRVDHHVYLNLPLKLGLQYQFNTPKTSSPSLSLSAHNRSIKLPASDSADIQFLDILSAGLEPMASSGFVKGKNKCSLVCFNERSSPHDIYFC